ncbi:conserved hypothetical protein [Rippkaea orientalis PCC 8801]|uniref:Glycosyltransferase RgtA/B/C/D-like domain-containing protein n=1 Tax=Rippkaea orientalis (strain PCC 8801 / RF-1) TaxID=41431 RepID=B7K3Y5_RIPO1|nr:hypothetical protein [Rippkaea orientalis]ACK66525.1 conserved hypothetical protein [Rippkaea orientalis PCC 8801]
MTILKKPISQWTINFIKSPDIYQGLLITSFAFITLIGILNHAMWRDELNGWLIARDSSSLSHFLNNIKYEGHPILWYLFLGILNQLTPNPLAMQLFHWLIATGCIAFFVIFSPFTKFQKTLFTFGYLPIYEYSLISRNYSIGLFSLFLFCCCFRTRHTSYIPLALILAIMANTNAYCLLISLALGLTLIVEYLMQKLLNYNSSSNRINILIALGIFSVGIVVSVWMLLPPQDSTLQGGASQWFLQFDWTRLNQTLTRIWRSYILILIPSDKKPTDLFIFAILSLGLLGFTSTIFIKKPVALFFYLFSSLELLLFTYLKFLGSARHYGHLYIILIVAWWIGSYYQNSNLLIDFLAKLPQRFKVLWLNWLTFVNRYKNTFLMIILSFQLIAGIVAFSRDLLTPYSASRDTANFIKQNRLESMMIVGSEDFTISPISGYLNRQIYYPESQKLGSYVLFNEQRKVITDQEIIQQVTQLMNQKEQDILLILNRQLDITHPTLNLLFLAKFDQAFIYNEKYYLYLIRNYSIES